MNVGVLVGRFDTRKYRENTGDHPFPPGTKKELTVGLREYVNSRKNNVVLKTIRVIGRSVGPPPTERVNY